MTILIDSDILIWYMRGHTGAKVSLDLIHPWYISVVTYIELVQGCRNKNELQQLKYGLTCRETQILPITPAISNKAMYLIDTHALSSGLRLADALIAATAIDNNFIVLTANGKHFSMIDELRIEQFMP